MWSRFDAPSPSPSAAASRPRHSLPSSFMPSTTVPRRRRCASARCRDTGRSGARRRRSCPTWVSTRTRRRRRRCRRRRRRRTLTDVAWQAPAAAAATAAAARRTAPSRRSRRLSATARTTPPLLRRPPLNGTVAGGGCAHAPGRLSIRLAARFRETATSTTRLQPMTSRSWRATDTCCARWRASRRATAPTLRRLCGPASRHACLGVRQQAQPTRRTRPTQRCRALPAPPSCVAAAPASTAHALRSQPTRRRSRMRGSP
mmetsp:Transcript_1948/g.6223  ORF Transcript_1948/g.6223 Transcript_1948/m.6223 type:complete len:259 (-) Transcript_1948:915-1691(-)